MSHSDAGRMSDHEARRVFDQVIEGETDKDRIAIIELCREYFVNPDFRAFLEKSIAEINGVS